MSRHTHRQAQTQRYAMTDSKMLTRHSWEGSGGPLLAVPGQLAPEPGYLVPSVTAQTQAAPGEPWGPQEWLWRC